MKHVFQSLKKLLELFGNAHFPEIFSQLEPNRHKSFLFPYLGSDYSRISLALKMTEMDGLKKKATTRELVNNFLGLTKKRQKFIAYTLSHEMKIATLAASIALNNQDSNIYEIGPCFGFSSLHFSHLIKEKTLSSKPISKLTAIEIKKPWFERALEIKKVVGDYVGEIEYLQGNGISYLWKTLKDRDIVFASIAEPNVLEGIFALSNAKRINLVVSYSETANREIRDRLTKEFENLLDPTVYNILPFEDKEYSKYVPWDIKKIGVLALSVRN